MVAPMTTPLYNPPHFSRGPAGGPASRPFAISALPTLVTEGSDGLIANHLPFLLDETRGVLRGHVARASPVWKEARAEREALAIFLGPDAYITPSWYATKAATGKVVPTWNYLAVHARGPLAFFDDAEGLRVLVTGSDQRA